MQDNQIYAYSWRRDLVKKIKTYFEKRKAANSAVSFVKIDKPSKNQQKIDSEPVKDIKTDTKQEKQTKVKTAKKQKEESLGTPLLRKERSEKILTYFIVTAMILIFLSGVLLANGFIKPPSTNLKLPAQILVSPTNFVSPAIETEVSITPTDGPKMSITPTKKYSLVTPPTTGCKINGCNGEICADESLGDISSICLYQDKYSCYKSSTCERQPDGKCDWTENDEFRACLDNYQ